ncbi:hypothetical protein J663_1652 [Acinetobacter sp. 826659]|nr:hypothetical protein J663_1652 [Acinetobacter sp. 826659]
MIITHTPKKHRIKNYQIFIFCINLYRKYLAAKQIKFLYFFTKLEKPIKPYIF